MKPRHNKGWACSSFGAVLIACGTIEVTDVAALQLRAFDSSSVTPRSTTAHSTDSCTAEQAFGVILCPDSLIMSRRVLGTYNASFDIVNNGAFDVVLRDVQASPPLDIEDKRGTVISAHGGRLPIKLKYKPVNRGKVCGQIIVTLKSVAAPEESLAYLPYCGTGLAPKIKVDSTTIDFGQVAVRGNGRVQTLHVSNVGDDTLTIKRLFRPNLGQPSFALQHPPLPWRIASASVDSMQIRFTPLSDKEEEQHTFVLISDSFQDDSLAITLKGKGFYGPGIGFDHYSLRFDSTCLGRTDTISMFMHNTGDETLVVERIRSENEEVFPSPLLQLDSLQPGDSILLHFRFQPQQAREYKSNLYAMSNKKGGRDRISVSGLGKTASFRVLPAEQLLKPLVAVVGDTVEAPFYIDNASDCPLVIDNIVVLPKVAPFEVSMSTNITIAPDSQSTVWVRYTPQDTLGDTAEVVVKARYFDELQRFSVYGKGLLGAFSSISPDTLNFDEVFVGKDSTLEARVHNRGYKAFSIDSITITGSSAFSIAPHPFPGNSIKIGAQGEHVFAVTYAPTGEAEHSALFTFIAPGAAPKEKTLFVKGKGRAVTSPQFCASKLALNFGTICESETDTATFTVTNCGGDTLRVEDIQWQLKHVFYVEPRNFKLAQNSTQNISVSFGPGGEAGEFLDTLSFKANLAAPFTLPLRARAERSIFAASKTMLDFHEVLLDESATESITFTNLGSKTITIKRVSTRLRQFQPDTIVDAVLQPNADTNIAVKFVPDDLMTFMDTLMIELDDARCAQNRIPLKGIGIGAQWTAPLSHDFDSVQVDTTSTWNFEIANQGTSPLKFEKIEYPPNPPFTITPPIPSEIGGITYKGVVAFTPDAIKSYPNALVLYAKHPRKQHRILLQGVGVDKIGPAITHEPRCTTYNLGDQVTVTAAFTDEVTYAENQTLYYRLGGDENFIAVPMTHVENNTWKGVVPQTVTERGFEYFFTAQDENQNPSQNPASGFYAISVSLPNGLRSPQALHDGKERSDYRMISVPLIMTDSVPFKVMKRSGFEAIADTRWRLFDYYNGNLVELTASLIDTVRSFRPGRAYWLITTEKEKYLTSGAGRTVPASADSCPVNAQYIRIPLEPGWNMVANPFLFDIKKSECALASGDALYNLQQFDILPDQATAGWKPWPVILKPWEGYALRTLRQDTLIFLTGKKPSAHAMARDAATENASWDWHVTIEARCGEYADLYNFAGVHAEARTGWDKWDLFDPPPIGTGVNVYFPHRDWPEYPSDYAGDFRPTFTTGEVWEFEVKSNLKDRQTTISIKNAVSFPSHLSVYIYDKNRQALQNLRENANYTFNNLGELLPGRFELIIGTLDFVQHRTSAITNNLPDEIQLYQNFPNPFNQETIFSFYLPQAAPVTLKVFDVLGREVRVLSEGRVWEKGRQFVRWEGEDHFKKRVSSGVYILVLQANSFTKQQRIVFLE